MIILLQDLIDLQGWRNILLLNEDFIAAENAYCLAGQRIACYLDVGAEGGGEGAGLVVVVEPERRVHAHVAVALVDVVEGEEAGAHEARAREQVLRVGLNLERRTKYQADQRSPLSLSQDLKSLKFPPHFLLH